MRTDRSELPTHRGHLRHLLEPGVAGQQPEQAFGGADVQGALVAQDREQQPAQATALPEMGQRRFHLDA